MKWKPFRWGEDAPKGRREPRRSGGRKKSGTRRLTEYAVILLVAFVVVFGVLRPFVVKSFWIPSESMVPTLEVGDRFLANKFIYRIREPERGDIIVFRSVEGGDEDLVKRVVAVAGDEVAVENGVLRVNDVTQNEPFTNKGFPDDGSFFGPMRVPEGEVFVMGDNRANSRDSRFFGPVPLENIEGEAVASFWPPSRIGVL